MNLIPINNSVIVKLTEEKMQNDAFFCSQQNNELKTGRVVTSDNKQILCEDKVLFFKYCASPFIFNNETFYIVNADDILAYVEEVYE